MSEEIRNQPGQPPVPTHYPLILAGAGLVLALFVLFTEQTFSVLGWAGLAMIVIGLGAWALLAPDQAKAALTGRTVRYGGTSFVVTVVFLTALVAIYTVVKGLDLRWDLTERDEFSLNDASRDAIARLAVDPESPDIEIIAFYGASQASYRDQLSVLLDDYVATGQGRISYEFSDPDRNPVLATQYKVERAGQIVVVAVQDGEPDVENAELVNYYSQEDLTNAILNVAASGDFRALFLAVDGGMALDQDMTILRDDFRDRFGWTVEEVTFFDLLSPESEYTLNDPAIDGEVLIIVGGLQALNDEEMAFLADYVDNGGDLIVYAELTTAVGESTLATADNFSTYMWDNFGLRFTQDIVLDQTQALQTPLLPVATDFDFSHYVTENFASLGAGLIYEAPYSIEVSDQPPADVTVTELVYSTANAYSKSDVTALLAGDITPTEADPRGPFVLGAAAENLETGARVVLFSSTSITADAYVIGSGIANLDAAFNAMVWTTHFNDFFQQVTVPVTTNL
ncbi:MAG: Gldg family protein, partial [Anaerolineae bacterium]|nr:Gldg family protein [Anaerolineae bacterium]